MCLAVPARVVAITDAHRCRIDLGGSTMSVNRTLLEEVAVGDIILLHAGFAIEKYDPAVAAEVIALWNEASDRAGKS